MHRLAAEVNVLRFPQQLGQVGVVGAGVGGAGQLHTAATSSSETALRGRAASIPVGQCGGALLAIARQNCHFPGSLTRHFHEH